MVGPGALKPKVGDGIKSRRPLSAPVLHSFILLFFFFVLCLLLHLYWCVYNNNNNNNNNNIHNASVYYVWLLTAYEFRRGFCTLVL